MMEHYFQTMLYGIRVSCISVHGAQSILQPNQLEASGKWAELKGGLDRLVNVLIGGIKTSLDKHQDCVEVMAMVRELETQYPSAYVMEKMHELRVACGEPESDDAQTVSETRVPGDANSALTA